MRTVRYAWALPVSAIGLAAAPLARLSGGGAAVVDGVLEVHGGVLARVLPRLVPGVRIAAITLGHVVLAVSADALARTRAHERVHVRQFEQWGPLLPLLYLASSAGAWIRGGHPYLDNHFERHAYREAPLA